MPSTLKIDNFDNDDGGNNINNCGGGEISNLDQNSVNFSAKSSQSRPENVKKSPGKKLVKSNKPKKFFGKLHF